MFISATEGTIWIWHQKRITFGEHVKLHSSLTTRDMFLHQKHQRWTPERNACAAFDAQCASLSLVTNDQISSVSFCLLASWISPIFCLVHDKHRIQWPQWFIGRIWGFTQICCWPANPFQLPVPILACRNLGRALMKCSIICAVLTHLQSQRMWRSLASSQCLESSSVGMCKWPYFSFIYFLQF